MLHNEIPELDTAGLKQFGLMLGGILIVLFGFILPWSRGWESSPNYYWVVIGILALIWAVLAPDSMRGLYNGWMKAANVISKVMNTVILAIVFFMVITPMGMIMRLAGKDPMRRAMDKNMTSYRVSSKIAAKNHIERPY